MITDLLGKVTIQVPACELWSSEAIRPKAVERFNFGGTKEIGWAKAEKMSWKTVYRAVGILQVPFSMPVRRDYSR